ncbi:MAG: HD domain-containing protein [Bacilli bacterium]|nr:HD domain-containing protein [Bacilli bacterium]
MTRRDINEFYNILDEYINHPKVLEMKGYAHHGIQRYDHCFRVAYHTYKVTKFLKLNYQSATKAAMLHDFWTDELEQEKNCLKRYRVHPSIAIENAKKYFSLNEMEEDIIGSHMFPLTFKPPRYLESWIVDFVDNVASVYEKYCSTKAEVKSLANVVALLFISILK